MGVIEQGRIASELVDDIAFEMRACSPGSSSAWVPTKRRDHAAAIDVADQHHGNIRSLGKAHIGDVASGAG